MPSGPSHDDDRRPAALEYIVLEAAVAESRAIHPGICASGIQQKHQSLRWTTEGGIQETKSAIVSISAFKRYRDDFAQICVPIGYQTLLAIFVSSRETRTRPERNKSHHDNCYPCTVHDDKNRWYKAGSEDGSKRCEQ